MDILGVGPLELIVILIIMLLVFGPDRLPEMGAKLGRSLRGMRRATREFSREIEAARAAVNAPIEEVKEPIQEIAEPFGQAADAAKKVAGAAQAARHPGRAIQQSLTRELSQATEQADVGAAASVEADQPAATASDATAQAEEGASPVAVEQASSAAEPDDALKGQPVGSEDSRDRGLAIEQSLKQASDVPALDTAAEPRISPFDDGPSSSSEDSAQGQVPTSDTSPVDHPEESSEEA